ncbi:MAG: class I SAM-dependent methyltransferase [bacterium]
MKKIPDKYILVEDKNSIKKQSKYALLCKGKAVLELGGVEGVFVEMCLKAGAKSVVSIDRYPLGPKVIKYDVLKYFKDTKKKFDIVYARHMIEHFSPIDVLYIMKQTYKCLNKDGMFVIVIPNLNNIAIATNEFWREFEHVRPYSILGVQQNLEQLGFEVVKVSPDYDSWDNSWYKNIVRAIRSLIVGLPYQAPDIYLIAVKK